jgi:hypothetical protein
MELLYSTTELIRSLKLILWPTVSRPVRIGVGLPNLLPDNYLLLHVRRRLWRGDGSAVQSVTGPRSAGPVVIYYSHLRLPPLGEPGPGLRIYISQEQGGQIILPGTGFPLRHLVRLAGCGGSILIRLKLLKYLLLQLQQLHYDWRSVG